MKIIIKIIIIIIIIIIVIVIVIVFSTHCTFAIIIILQVNTLNVIGFVSGRVTLL